ncbi:MAG: hypothetical protein QOK10_2453 [Pseudonocardiales bacterium]|jgi:probable phosphoglycerate mutase|nr:hypothetical protein [Pseudonocardiales bacterium]
MTPCLCKAACEPLTGMFGAMPITELILVRHGESRGNVAREIAEAASAERIDIDRRDADVELSELGRDQARSFGRWLASRPADQPDLVWCSPYLRARQTADIVLSEAGLERKIHLDERVRDRELGVLDMLTSVGVRAAFPAEADRRRWLGKLYYRPPGGESWSDVALRIRSLLADLERRPAAEHTRVLIVAHDAVILLFRYVCEELDEAALFDIVRSGSIGNASLTKLARDGVDRPWRCTAYNREDHLLQFGSSPTEHPGEPDAAQPGEPDAARR